MLEGKQFVMCLRRWDDSLCHLEFVFLSNLLLVQSTLLDGFTRQVLNDILDDFWPLTRITLHVMQVVLEIQVNLWFLLLSFVHRLPCDARFGALRQGTIILWYVVSLALLWLNILGLETGDIGQ